MSIHRKVLGLLWGGCLGCLVAIAFLWMSGVAVAQASPKCVHRADLVKYLHDKYQEVPIAIGMINEGLIMETFGSPSGTWTIFLTNTENVSCMVADGVNWAFDTRAFDKAKKGRAM